MQAEHRIAHDRTSILSVAISSSHIYAGTHNDNITVHDRRTYAHVTDLTGHYGSILSLHLSPDETKLFSSASDSIIRCWNTATFQCLHVIYSTYDVGDIFATAYSVAQDTLFLGSQNTSLQWVKLGCERPVPSRDAYPTRRPNKFFDSTGPSGRSALPIRNAAFHSRSNSLEQPEPATLIEIDKEDIIQYAHYSYVFCLLLGLVGSVEVLFTGGGDASINIWSLDGSPRQMRSLCQSQGTQVLTLAQKESLLYAGQGRGYISVWDLETNQLLRRIEAHDAHVQSISISNHYLFSIGGESLNVYDIQSGIEEIDRVMAHNGKALCSATVASKDARLLVTGGRDDGIAVWNISQITARQALERPSSSGSGSSTEAEDAFLQSLYTFVSFKSVSGSDAHVEDCRRAATFLKNLALGLGAEASLIPTANNPIVMIKFTANTKLEAKARSVLYYGHYDVISAVEERWTSSPWKLVGKNGYLYARGVSDNKAPILSALYAAHELLVAHSLAVDLTMLIEGEEESGSRGFQEAITNTRKPGYLEHFDEVFLSNSYWLDDDIPCITYGLRGVIHASVEVGNSLPDLHSGVEGGSVREPTIDLVNLLSKLTHDTGRIAIPEFYDPVRSVSEHEREFYEQIASSQIMARTGTSSSSSRIKVHVEDSTKDERELEELMVEDLMNRWCQPSLTVHRIEVSGPGNSTVIPHSAVSTISIRIVPDQDLETIATGLESYLHQSFKQFQSRNKLTVKIEKTSDWWLSPPTSAPFTRLAKLIEREWQVKPLIIREGGSIPMVRWLEQEFGAIAVHFPMGQSSDCAHLSDERLRILNLEKGRAIIKGYFSP